MSATFRSACVVEDLAASYNKGVTDQAAVDGSPSTFEQTVYGMVEKPISTSMRKGFRAAVKPTGAFNDFAHDLTDQPWAVYELRFT